MGRGRGGEGDQLSVEILDITPTSFGDERAQKWLDDQRGDPALESLWSDWVRHLQKEERERFMSIARSINGSDIKEWAKNKDDCSNSRVREIAEAFPSKKASDSLDGDKVGVLDKAWNYALDKNLDFVDVVRELQKSEIFASALQKNATKQSPYEPLAAAWLSSKGALTLQLSRKESRLDIRFSNDGSFHVGGKAEDADSKSADLATVIEKDGKVVMYLVSHKFARVAGGHQKNQEKDADMFLSCAAKAAKKHPDITELRELAAKALGRPVSAEEFSWQPALILDGEYFSGRSSQGPLFVGSSDSFAKHLGL